VRRFEVELLEQGEPTYCKPCCPIAPFFGSTLTIVGISFDIIIDLAEKAFDAVMDGESCGYSCDKRFCSNTLKPYMAYVV
jgi:hypothetical protein